METIESPLRVNGILVLALMIFGVYSELSYLTWAGIIILGLSLLSSRFNESLAYGWMKFAFLIGTFNSKVILSIIFYGFLTPTAFLVRLIGWGSFPDENDECKSYFVDRNKLFDPEDFEKTW